MPAITPHQARERIFTHLAAMLIYWRDIPEPQLLAGNSNADVVHERMTGFLFSILTAIDGSASLPSFDLVPRDDEDWPTTSINADVELHAAFPFSLIEPPHM